MAGLTTILSRQFASTILYQGDGLLKRKRPILFSLGRFPTYNSYMDVGLSPSALSSKTAMLPYCWQCGRLATATSDRLAERLVLTIESPPFALSRLIKGLLIKVALRCTPVKVRRSDYSRFSPVCTYFCDHSVAEYLSGNSSATSTGPMRSFAHRAFRQYAATLSIVRLLL